MNKIDKFARMKKLIQIKYEITVGVKKSIQILHILKRY